MWTKKKEIKKFFRGSWGLRDGSPSRRKKNLKTFLKFMEVEGRVTSGAPPPHPAARVGPSRAMHRRGSSFTQEKRVFQKLF